MTIGSVNNSIIEKIKRKSAYSLPDNPSELGYRADEIRQAFYRPITDSASSVISEINRIVGEINSEMSDKLGKTDNSINTSNHDVVGAINSVLETHDTTDKVDKQVVSQTKTSSILRDRDGNLDIKVNSNQYPTVYGSLHLTQSGVRIQGLTANISVNDGVASYNRGNAYDGEIATKKYANTFAKSFSLTINENDYKMTAKLYDNSGNELSTQVIDLPLETMVVNASYNNNSKTITLTLKNGTTTSFSISDLVSGLVSENVIGSLSNLLTTDKTSIVGAINELSRDISSKQDALTAGSNITINNGVISSTGGINSVSVSQTLQSGVEIGSVTVNGSETKFYAPQGGSNNVMYNNNIHYNLPIGSIFASSVKLTDAWVHILDGSTISQHGTYADFSTWLHTQITAGNVPTCTNAEFEADVTNTGSCGKFVVDDTNLTIRLPKITTFIQGTNTNANIGKANSPGLPNITGHIDWVVSWTGGCGGAFYNKGNNNSCSGSGDQVARDFVFNASRSNSIYGNSNTVQPPSVEYPYYIVLANQTKTAVEIDIDNYQSDISNIQGSVSSLQATVNSVANLPNYSSDEMLTGGTWIDGKPIYRKVFTFTLNGTVSPNTWTTLFSANLSVDKVIKSVVLSGSSTQPCQLNYFTVAYYKNDGVFKGIHSRNVNIEISANSFVIVEYTKI